MGRMPDFLVIGAARSGTTALHAYLRQHPAIHMSAVKEPNFFAYEGERPACRGPGADYINNSITDPEAYAALFADAPPDALCGEASPLYLYSPEAPARAARRIPQARLVAILRNPVEQAWSHFLYAKRQRLEPLDDFAEALRREEERLAAGWQPLFGYSRFPRYHEQLSRWRAHFPEERILIRLYEDFEADPAGVAAEIFRFLGVAADFRPDMSWRPNAGGVPRSALIQDLLLKPSLLTRAVAAVTPEETRRRVRDALVRRNLRRGQEMSGEAREILNERLREEILRLQDLLGRDLGAWLDRAPAAARLRP